MGTKVPTVPDDYGFGYDCLSCHPAGKTPNYVFVRIWDVQPCPGEFPPPNGYCFICKQMDSDPCIWHGEIEIYSGKWSCDYDAHARYGEEYRSELNVYHTDPIEVGVFFGRGPACGALIDNLYTNCLMGNGFAGRAVVTIYIDPIIIFLTSCAHLVVLPKTLYERWDVGMDHSIYRLANKTDHTNVMVYIDREVIESE